MKYHAFISYSHAADGQLAPALQLALEKFAKPWYKIRNLNIFRDESTLAASPQLWDNIVKALDQSEYLVYLASPEAAASKWVNQELEFWRENKSLDKLIIVLTEGEILWDDKRNSFANSGESAIPPVLHDAFSGEPFYIDLRASRSTHDLKLSNPIFKKEVLKLAAHIHGMAPKDMAGEEVLAHRRMMRVRNGAILTLLVLLGFSIVQTVNARSERKRAEEEAAIAIRERDIARAAKDEAVPWIVRATWRSGEEYEQPSSWVTGIRMLIEHASPIVNLQKVRFLSPYEIFLSSPHDSTFNWNSNEFAHYNPEFLNWATDYLIPGAEDESFREATQAIYDKHLSMLARAYGRTYAYLRLDPDFVEREKELYLAYLASGGGENYFNSGDFDSFFEDMELLQPGVFPYYAHTAAGFWIRREIDGTADEFITLINKLIDTYDPGLARECAAVRYPFRNASAEFLPGVWSIRDGDGLASFAYFLEDGRLLVTINNRRYEHRWENLGQDLYRIDGAEVAVRYYDLLNGVPELSGDVSINKLFPEQSHDFDDPSGKEISNINMNFIETSAGRFQRTNPGVWTGPDPYGAMVRYTEIGRAEYEGIYLVDDRGINLSINPSPYRNNVLATIGDNPAMEMARIIRTGRE